MKIGFRFFASIFFMISWSNISVADHIIVEGDVSGEWNADTVLVAGDLSVADGHLLLVHPGTVVLFQGSFVFDIEGSIQANGMENDSIYFCIADTSGFSIDSIPDGGWRGIRFEENRYSNEPSLFNYCRFSYGKNTEADPLNGNGGALSVRAYDNVTVNACRFTGNYAIYNGGAIALDSADINIEFSVFERNRCGLPVAPWGYGGAVCSDNSSPEIRWNVFAGNSSTGVGGGLSVRYKDCNVYNNIFTGNLSGLGGGLCVLHIAEISHHVNNNLLAGNSALYFGGGVATMDASPVYINNTIANNTAAYGGGFYCKDSISPVFYNTIFWGNTAAVGPTGYLFEVYARADFFHCDVEGGTLQFGGSGGGEAFSGIYEQCIDLDPQFIDTGDFPYQPDPAASPCIDTGSPDTSGFSLPLIDLAGNPRHSHAFIDIGAYESVWVGVEDEEQGSGEAGKRGKVEVYPNPTGGKFKVQSAKFKDEIQSLEFKVEVADIFGNVLLAKDWDSDSNACGVDISHLPAGTYLVKVICTDEIFTRKIIKVKR